MKMGRFLSITILVLCASQVWARILSVPSEYPSIQSAINDAKNGDTAIVSPGTYQENINFLGKAIIVQSVNPNDPNIVAGTIIDGNAPADSNFGSVVTFNSGEDNNSVLSGFTITGGTGSWLLISWEFKGLQWNRCGGGVVCYNMSAPTISKNVFTGNSAGQGGGIYIYGDPINPNDPSNPAIHISPVITDNSFINNSAIIEHGFAPPDTNYPCNDHGDGGAIVGFQGCDATITGNLIENNSADLYGGGLHLRQWSNGLIENNHIIDNSSTLGAGIHITYTSSPTIRNNLVQANTASSLGGGGIYVYYQSGPLIERNTITENTSSHGAGMGVFWDSCPTIRNNFIYNNLAGAGIHITDSDPEIVHNTITHNYYGGIYCGLGSNPDIENNIITSNGDGWGIRVNDNGSSLVIRYNNIWGNSSGTCGPNIPDQTGINGNICVEPGFLDGDNNDYHLNYDSKCINAGDPNFTGEGLTDYDNEPRKLSQFVDIGADEAWPIWNITSNGRYDSIQQSINDANDLDTIIVTEGRYIENINFDGKGVTLRSIDPNDWDVVEKTIIDGNNNANNRGTVVTFVSGEDANSVLAGFTIKGGYQDTNDLQGGYGGGIKCHSYSSPTILRNIIRDNYAVEGAGISLYHSSSLVKNNIFTNNKGTQYSLGGGMCIIDCEAPTIVNNLVVGNESSAGGGIMLIHSNATITNDTIAFNRSSSTAGVYIESSYDTIANCIIWNDGDDVYQSEGCSEVKYSCIEDGDAGEGNISDDPNFIDPGYWDDSNTPGNQEDDFFVFGNYHIPPDSPCVNSGDNSFVPDVSTTDIDGEQRIFDDIVDMGADEVVTNPIDLNNDGIVDYYELAVLTGEWLQDSELQTDFYDDDFIDFADLAILAEQWLWKGGWYQ